MVLKQIVEPFESRRKPTMNSKRFFVLALAIVVLNVGAVSAQVAQNLMGNPEFDKQKGGWGFKGYNGAAYTSSVVAGHLLSGDNSLAVTCQTGGTQLADIEVTQAKTLQTGRYYHFSFMAMSDKPRVIKLGIDEYSGEKRTLWSTDSIWISSKPGHYGPYVFRCRLPDASYKFKFMLGGMDNVTVNLDSVWMTMTDDPEYFRPEELFEYHHHPYQDLSLPYRWFTPVNREPSKRYPIVLALHGSGEAGTDNELSLSPQHRLAFTWSDSANQAKWPCYVLVPQCPLDDQWEVNHSADGGFRISGNPIRKPLAAVVDLLDSLVRAFPIDSARIYVTGLSMGGFGSFELIERYPGRFAAAVPMSGGGDSTLVRAIMDVPIWDFHGDTDTTVPPSGSRQMMEAFERTGRAVFYTYCHNGVCEADPTAKADEAVASGATLIYTEAKGIQHGTWAPWYDMPQLHEWLFSQSLNKRTGIAGREYLNPAAGFSLSQNYPNPFNPSTRIRYTLAGKSEVSIEIFDGRGRRVAVLADGTQEAGSHTAVFDAAGQPSGMYLVRLAVNGQLRMKRMVLVK
jgi:predicted peptidase